MSALSEAPKPEVIQAQLHQSYETARTIFKLTLQMIGIAAAGVVGLVTFGFGQKNPFALIIAGFLALIILGQVFFAWRVLDAVVLLAVGLERDIGLDGRRSLVSTAYGAFFSLRALLRLQQRASERLDESQAALLKQATKGFEDPHAARFVALAEWPRVMSRNKDTWAAGVFGLFLIVLGVVLYFTVWH